MTSESTRRHSTASGPSLTTTLVSTCSRSPYLDTNYWSTDVQALSPDVWLLSPLACRGASVSRAHFSHAPRCPCPPRALRPARARGDRQPAKRLDEDSRGHGSTRRHERHPSRAAGRP